MRRSNRGSAGEESDEEWVEEQIERDESTESLDELGLPLTSSKSSSNPRPSSSHSHFDSANLIVLDFGPSSKGRLQYPLSYVNLLLIFRVSLNCSEWFHLLLICFISTDQYREVGQVHQLSLCNKSPMFLSMQNAERLSILFTIDAFIPNIAQFFPETQIVHFLHCSRS